MLNSGCNEGIRDHAGIPNTFHGFNDQTWEFETFTKHEWKWNLNVFHRSLANVDKRDHRIFRIKITINTHSWLPVCLWASAEPRSLQADPITKVPSMKMVL